MTESNNALPLAALPIVTPGPGFLMLSGVRVIDLTTSIAGPYGSMLLADFGAEVIKVERPGGDDARSWGPPFFDGESLWFSSVNRGKKSVVLDLSTPAGLAGLKSLVATADVLVTNQPLDVQKKLGVSYEQVRAIKPDLIFVALTGFGLTGRRSTLTSYDLIAEGHSGVMELTGAADGPPQKIGAPAADMLAGQDAAMATMAALFDRHRTGQGKLIDVSLVESMTRFVTCRLSAYMGSGQQQRRSGGTDSVLAVYQQFDTADLPLTLGIGTDAIWRRFWASLGDPDFAGSPGFETNASRRERRPEIVERIATILQRRKRDAWLEDFAAARIPAGPVLSVDAVVADPALQERGLLFTLSDGQRSIPQVGLGIHIDGAAGRPSSLPPRLGEHTAEIFADLQSSEGTAER